MEAGEVERKDSAALSRWESTNAAGFNSGH